MAKAKTRALQLNIEGLIKLLGGTAAERARYWEIRKGITTPIELRLVAGQLDALQNLVDQVNAGTKALGETMSQIAKQ